MKSPRDYRRSPVTLLTLEHMSSAAESGVSISEGISSMEKLLWRICSMSLSYLLLTKHSILSLPRLALHPTHKQLTSARSQPHRHQRRRRQLGARRAEPRPSVSPAVFAAQLGSRACGYRRK